VAGSGLGGDGRDVPVAFLVALAVRLPD